MANSFSYSGAKSTMNTAKKALDKYNKTSVKDWTGGTYGVAMKDVMNRINNREQFSYDMNADALYQQYKNQYMNLGKLAMQDTVGNAAALTGGYGNSYAVTAGNQAYQSYLDQVNDKIPQLYQLAMDRYQMESQDLYNKLGMYQDMYGQEYGEYRDKVSDWNTGYDRLYNAYNNAYSNAMNWYNIEQQKKNIASSGGSGGGGGRSGGSSKSSKTTSTPTPVKTPTPAYTPASQKGTPLSPDELYAALYMDDQKKKQQKNDLLDRAAKTAALYASWGT